MAYQFDGNGDSIVFDVDSSVATITSFSVAFHLIKDSFSSAYRDVIWLGGEYDANHNFLIQHDQSNYIAIDVNWSTSNGRWSIDVPDTNWHNYVVTYNSDSTGNDPLWYKDGASQAVTERNTPNGSRSSSSRNKITLGANSDFYGPSGEYWLGKAGEYAIWNRVLTPAEATIIGDGYSPLFIPNGLIFYAPLIRNTQNLLYASTGTVNNAVVYPHSRVINPSSSWDNTGHPLQQSGFRWRDDDGSETTASWLEPQNTHIIRDKNMNTRVRLLINSSGDVGSKNFQLEYRRKGQGDPWKKVV